MTGIDYDHSDADSEREADGKSPTELTQAKHKLRPLINSVRLDGSFASGAIVKDYVDPQIACITLGEEQAKEQLVRLPLVEEDANKLIPARRASPVGGGPNPWLANAKSFQIRNDAFQHVLARLSDEATAALAVPKHVSITAQLRDFVLFERGSASGSTLRTSDTAAKASLLVVLPSDHLGGNFSVSVGNAVKQIEIAPNQASYVCWYSDAILAVQDIKAGHVCGLLYDILEDQPSNALDELQTSLKSALESWTSSRSESKELLLVLDHEYTAESLRLDRLKGSDLSIANALSNLAPEMGLSLFLASMKRKIKVGGEETGGEVYQKRLKLVRVHDLEGVQLTTELPVSVKQIIQDGVYSDRQPDHTDEKWEDADYSNQYYLNHVLILVRHNDVASFLMRPPAGRSYKRVNNRTSSCTLLRTYLRKLDATARHVTIQRELLQLCDYVTHGMQEAKKKAKSSGYASYPFTDDVVGVIVEALLALGETTRVTEAVTCTAEQLPPDAIEALRASSETVPRDILETILDKALASYRTPAKRLNILQTLFGEELTLRGDCWKSWAWNSMLSAIKACCEEQPTDDRTRNDIRNFDKNNPFKEADEDGAALAELVSRMGSLRSLSDVILPLLKRFSHNARLLVGFFGRLHATAGSWSEDEIGLTRQVFLDVYSSNDLVLHGPVASEPHWDRSQDELSPPIGRYLRMSVGEALAEIIKLAFTLDSPTVVATLLERILAGATKTPGKSFGNIYLPFVNAMIRLEPNSIPAELGNHVRDLVIKILGLYISLYVQKQPAQGADTMQHKRRWGHSHWDGSSKHEAWAKRCGTAVGRLRELNQDQLLQRVLGDEYDRILSLGDVVVEWRTAPSFLSRRLLAEQSDVSSVSDAQTGQKRKIEVIVID